MFDIPLDGKKFLKSAKIVVTVFNLCSVLGNLQRFYIPWRDETTFVFLRDDHLAGCPLYNVSICYPRTSMRFGVRFSHIDGAQFFYKNPYYNMFHALYLPYTCHTNSMEQNLSSDSWWACQISCILWNPKSYCHFHNSPPLVRILSQKKPVHVIPYMSRS